MMKFLQILLAMLLLSSIASCGDKSQSGSGIEDNSQIEEAEHQHGVEEFLAESDLAVAVR